MKLIKWIPYETSEYKSYLDPSDELLKLRNPNKKLWIREDDDTVKEYAEKNRIGIDKAFKIIKEKNEKLPDWIDEDKADFYKDINEVCRYKLKKYCIDNKIFITDGQHQTSMIPVFQDDDNQRYTLLYSLRAWSGLMAEVWNEILKTDKYYYLDFYCDSRNTEIDEYLKNIGKL